MNAEEREAIKAELRAELLQEMTQRKETKYAMRQVLDEFDSEYRKFGDRGRHKVREAISTLIRMKYGDCHISRIPGDELGKARIIVRDILAMCAPS